MACHQRLSWVAFLMSCRAGCGSHAEHMHCAMGCMRSPTCTVSCAEIQTQRVLDLGLHVVDGVAGLHIKGDGLASQRLHKDLHATSQAQHQVKGGFLLNVVV